MPQRLDADTALLNLVGGRPAPHDPLGLATFTPPRKTARGREKDALFLCLGLRARTPVMAERYTELLNLAAATFYGQPGSVTAAARQALAAVNQKLLDANANLSEGAPCTGGLICAVLRGADFYVVQSGPGVVTVAHPTAVERFPNVASRPLGLSDALDAQYFHTAVGVGEYFALSPNAQWVEPALTGLGGLATLSAVAERLKAAAGADFTALVARFEPAGTLGEAPQPPPALRVSTAGPAAREVVAAPPLADRLREVRRVQPKPEPEVEPTPVSALPLTADASPAPTPEASAPEKNGAASASTDWQALLRRAERLDTAQPSDATSGYEPPHIPITETDEADSEEVSESLSEPTPFRREAASALSGVGAKAQDSLRSFGRALGVTITEAVRGVSKLVARSLPEGMLQRDGLFSVPSSVQISIALLTPLVIVGLGLMLYFQYGQDKLFADAIEQAKTSLEQAHGAPDPLAARPFWEAAVRWVNQAEALRPDHPELVPLRQEAQGQLDELDWVTRLAYQPLIVGGVPNAKFTQVVLVGSDVYVLDENGNRVVRLMQSNTGNYLVDPGFQCAGGGLGPITIGSLIDIGFLPGPNVRDTDAIVALDTAGGLLYCAPGEPPLGSYLTAPDTGWKQPIAMEIYGDSLYAFDAGQNQIWQFQSSGGAFNQPPRGYFTQVIYNLSDAVDFAITGGDLMILRRDGAAALCSRAQVGGDAACIEKAPYADTRLGHTTPAERLADVTAPRRLVYDQPPEPSVLLLDGNTSALYQLSLKLNLARQFRPATPLPAPITAVTIDPSKRLFVSAGDNVYVASRP